MVYDVFDVAPDGVMLVCTNDTSPESVARWLAATRPKEQWVPCEGSEKCPTCPAVMRHFEFVRADVPALKS